MCVERERWSRAREERRGTFSRAAECGVRRSLVGGVGGEGDNARENNGGQRGREIGGVWLVWKMGERWSEVSP